MIFEALILGLIFGKLRGGQLKRLGYRTLDFPILIIISFILLLGTSILIQLGNPVAIQYRMFLYIGAYCLLFIVLFFNLHNRALWLILVGAILNFAAIVLNQGSMPVDLNLLARAGFQNMLQSTINIGALPNYISLENALGFTAYLGKRLVTPAFYPLKQIMSVGDIFISLGLLIYVQALMCSRSHHRAAGVIRFDQQKGIRA